MQGEIIPDTPLSEDNLPPEQTASIDDNIEESQDNSTVEANSSPFDQPLVEYEIEEAVVPETIEPVSVPVPEETHHMIAPLVTPTKLLQTSISRLRGSESPSSATHMGSIQPEDDKNALTEVIGLEVENDRAAVNERQEEEEEETHGEAESKEEEEESKDGEDNRKEEEEESREGEGKEEAKGPEEKANQEGMERKVMEEEREREECKGEETESNAVAEDDSQGRHTSPQGQDEQMEIDHEQDDQTSLGNNAELDGETESDNAVTPAEIANSPSSLNPAEAVDDEHTSGDEPVVFTRRVYYEKIHILNPHF